MADWPSSPEYIQYSATVVHLGHRLLLWNHKDVGNSFSLLRGSGGSRRGLAVPGLLLLGSPSMRGLSGGRFAMGCVPMVPPSSYGARQGSGWGGKGGGAARRWRGARLGFAAKFDGIDDVLGDFL
jgi:hypothetical protein